MPKCNRNGRGINTNTLQTAHLYADGHAVLQHKETVSKKGRPDVTVTWAEVFEKLGPVVEGFSGRLELSGELIKMIKKTDKIRVQNNQIIATVSGGFTVEPLKEGFEVQDEEQSYADIAEATEVDGHMITRRHSVKVAPAVTEEAVMGE